jgi:hypothetical protein
MIIKFDVIYCSGVECGDGICPLSHVPYMSGYKNFAVVGAGATGSYLVRQFVKDKAAGTVDRVVVLTRQVSPFFFFNNHDCNT